MLKGLKYLAEVIIHQNQMVDSALMISLCLK